MILDNLGLSANEVKERMKSTGDMTKAVGQIIREQMESAGGYVETAADRAKQKETELQNAYMELGRAFMPIKESADDLFHSMQLGAMKVITSLGSMLSLLTSAGKAQQSFGKLGGNERVSKMLDQLKGRNGKAVYQKQQAEMWKYINPREQYLKDLDSWRKGNRSEGLQQRIAKGRERFGVDDRSIRADVSGAKTMLSEYQKGAEKIFNPVVEQPKITTPKTTKTTKVEDTNYAADSIMAQEKLISDLTDKWQRAGAAVRGDYAKQLDEAKEKLKKMQDEPLAEKIKFSPVQMKTEDFELPVKLKYENAQAGIEEILKEAKEGVATSEIGSEMFNKMTEQLKDATALSGIISAAMKNGIDMGDYQDSVAALYSKLLGGDVPEEDIEAFVEKLNEKLAEKGVKISIGEDGTASTEKEKDGKDKDKEGSPEEKKQTTTISEGFGKLSGGLNQITSGLEQLGIEIPQELSSIFGVMQTVTTILSGIASTVMAIQLLTTAKSFLPIFATGGIVHAAGGVRVPGNLMSGDMVPAMLNSGEVVLNKAQQGNVASQMQGSGLSNLRLSTTVSGDELRFVLGANNKMQGLGDSLTFDL